MKSRTRKSKDPQERHPEVEWSRQENYRVWEANRKVFLLPENYLEPEPLARTKDTMLPEREKDLLRQITTEVSQQVRARGGSGSASAKEGNGVIVMFAGGNARGRAITGETLAKELKLDLYRIDLSTVVSKYVGETEKNLKKVFDAAENTRAILLFDEADALFGKRSEVKDSHDRYANIEANYLLEQMENYSGLTILATNMTNELDPPLMRRFRFVVNLPFIGEKRN